MPGLGKGNYQLSLSQPFSSFSPLSSDPSGFPVGRDVTSQILLYQETTSCVKSFLYCGSNNSKVKSGSDSWKGLTRFGGW